MLVLLGRCCNKPGRPAWDSAWGKGRPGGYLPELDSVSVSQNCNVGTVGPLLHYQPGSQPVSQPGTDFGARPGQVSSLSC